MLSNFSKVSIAIACFLTALFLSFSYSLPPFSYLYTSEKEDAQVVYQNQSKEPVSLTIATSSDSLLATSSASMSSSSTLVESKEVPPIVAQKQVTPTKIAKQTSSVYEELHTHHSDTDESYRPKISPCVKPMKYKVGTFDSRFGISREEFLSITTDAVSEWERESGKKLFVYDPNGELTLNLIFDERQATTIDLGYLALEIENTKQVAEDIRGAYEKEKEVYIEDTALFNADAKSYQDRYELYNNKVKYYNEKGGATKIEYEAMMLELEGLKKEASAFEVRRADLTIRMEDINKRVARYNDLVRYVNTLIRKSNASGGRTFTEGRFTPSSNTIDIFQYANETKLRRVLMHEFGHALGIGHVENAQSIMFSFNSGTTTAMTTEDKEALSEICSQ